MRFQGADSETQWKKIEKIKITSIKKTNELMENKSLEDGQKGPN